MREEIWLQGSPVATGIAIGLPFFLKERLSFPEKKETLSESSSKLTQGAVHKKKVSGTKQVFDHHHDTQDLEIGKFRRAVSQNQAELRELITRLTTSQHIKEADLVESVLLLAIDPVFLDMIELKIRNQKKTAVQSLREVRDDLHCCFQALAQPYLRQRFEDIQGICDRFIALLTEEKPGEVLVNISVDAILCAHYVTAPLAAQVSVNGIGAIVTACGGAMSHTAIIAKSRGIPYVSNLDISSVEGLSTQDPIVVDGGAGVVILRPTEKTLRRYMDLKKGQGRSVCEECAITPVSATTKDGHSVKLMANVAKENDVYQVSQYSLDGVGLYRTEYQVLEKRRIPTEEEQLKAYSSMVRASKGRPVVIRVFDFGSDKGWEEVLERIPATAQKKRSLSLLLECQDLFRSQLRAILRASRQGPLSILFPMVSSLAELQNCLQVLREVFQEVSLESSLLFPRVGAMLETPSILFHLKEVAQHVDFLSLGTNDLIQYAFAVDRSNTAIFDYHISFHPGLMHLIRYLAIQVRELDIPLCVCGEMASDQLLVPFLIGLGIRELSIAPRLASHVRKILLSFTKKEMETIAEKVLQARSAQEIFILLRSYHATVDAG